jgi:peptidoglycan/xylan/chitin deacetylase (PgdA/CDA1 family)
LVHPQRSPSTEGPWALTFGEVTRAAPGKRQIALTFDASGSADGLPALLVALRHASVKCTFFLTGEWVQRYPKAARQIIADGHEIGNHTWGHRDLTRLADPEVSWEIQRAEAALHAVLGRRARPWFRAPFGARNARVLTVARALGYRSVYWSLDGFDAVRTGQPSASIVSYVTAQPDEALDGAIIRFEVGDVPTAHAMAGILRALEARHLEPVPVSTLIPAPGTNGHGSSYEAFSR